MFRFEHTDFLWALMLIPLLSGVFVWMMVWKKKALHRFGEWSVIRRLLPGQSDGRIIFKFVLLMIGYLLMIIGLSNPQIGSKLIEGERKGIDIMIALDVSNSMLAEDIKPNRIEMSRQAISKLIDNLGTDRIGIW
ncbi:MAG: VWA domain-containing protein, partial [Bacteroidetes bacterium]|nr:VWA domain-containing protein [Bacteroidota bacterium]